MKLLNKLACAATVAFAFAGSANASVVMNNWVFNPNGGGFEDGYKVKEYLDVNGNSFIQLNTTAGNPNFTFVEHAVFNVVQADSKGQLFPLLYPGGNITATFEGFGTGKLGEAFTFTGGSIKIYQNPVNGQYATTSGIYGANLGNLIASFDVLMGGGGEVDASGNPIGNGNVTVYAKAAAGDLMPGYWFRGNGDDLSDESVLSFAFTNANPLAEPDGTLVSEVACQFAGFSGAGCNGSAYANAPGSYFFVSNNGQFKLAEVPEPGSLALFGIAMLGAGVVSRRRAKKA
ncbi:MAG TPA: flocculation-associated PEP-CTERM protein PepA [Telluria sp.]|nr:flocculation-associated PEP-CTERM protein PepA [Telluria sp.]